MTAVENVYSQRPLSHHFRTKRRETRRIAGRAWFLHCAFLIRQKSCKTLSRRPDSRTAPHLGPISFIERRLGPDRRSTTLRSFLRGGFTPRRRGGRRAGEHHLPIDWHEPYLLFLSVTILLLSVVDAFLTLTLLTAGATEANPVMAFVLSHHPQLFALIKMAFTSIGVLVLVAVARARLFRVMKVGAVLQGLFVAYVALIAYEWWLLRMIL